MEGGETARERTARILHGLPQTRHSALTPEGEIEQAGKIADGLRAARHGWRKVIVRAGFIVIGAAVLVSLVMAGYEAAR